jgi:hypothetical protein
VQVTSSQTIRIGIDRDRMIIAWQPAVPDWISALANLCDATSQR